MSSKLRMLTERLAYSGSNVNVIVRLLSDEYSRLHCDEVKAIEYAVEQCEGLCLYCGVELYDTEAYPSSHLHLDHIYPASYGGLFAQGNVALSCASCNLSKSNKDPIQFYKDRLKRGQKCRFSSQDEFEDILGEYMKPYKMQHPEHYALYHKVLKSNVVEVNDIMSHFISNINDLNLTKFGRRGELMSTVSHSEHELIYDNTFNKTSLSGVTPMAHSVLLAILLVAQKEGVMNEDNCLSVSLKHSLIREITGLKNMTASDIIRATEQIEELCVDYYSYNDDGVLEKEPGLVLQSIKLDNDSREISVEVSKMMESKLRASESNFTAVDVRESSSMNSIYSQELHRLLSQFKSTGWFIMGANEWRHHFNVSDKYSDNYIIRKQIAPAIERNREFFDGLTTNVIESTSKLPSTMTFKFARQKRTLR